MTCFLLPAALALASPLSAQLLDDTLIADINNDGQSVVGSYSGAFAADGELVYFRGIDAASNESHRFWCTNGSEAGTVQITTLSMSVIDSAFEPGGDLVFLADELGIGVALWRSDGTPEGTVELLAPMAWTEEPHDLAVFDGAAWFVAAVAGEGAEVWRTDLASGATTMAIDLVPGAASGAGRLFAGGGHLYVASEDWTTLWSYDGSPGSLTQVATFWHSLVALAFDRIAEVGSRVIFEIGGFSTEAGWWSSDGTAAGTLRLTETYNEHWLVQADSKVYFSAGPQAGVVRLYESDGTLAGTLPIDLPTTTGGQFVDTAGGIAIGDELFYPGYVPGVGFELCRTTGAAGGGQLVEDIRVGEGDAELSNFTTFDGDVYFRADDGVNGNEIWRLDPSGNDAELVFESTPGSGASIVGAIDGAAEAVVFGQSFPSFGVEPAFTDGTQGGILLNIGNDGESDGSGPEQFLRLGNQVLFSALDETVGVELWRTDGTAAGTWLVADIDPINAGVPGTFGSFPRELARFGDRAFFFASHIDYGRELWSSDGTAAGTELVIDLEPGPVGTVPIAAVEPVELDGRLYFIAEHPDTSHVLYRTDGTAAGTESVATTDAETEFLQQIVLERVGDALLYVIDDPGVSGRELWTTDGQSAGELLVDANPGDGGIYVAELVVGEGVAYFTALHDSLRSLWVTDGTPGGTAQLFAQPPGAFPPERLAVLGDTLFFQADDGIFGREPWISDGTAGGTALLVDIASGAASSRSAAFTPAADRVFFAVESPPGTGHFQEVWISDGTALGTELVADLDSPVAGEGVSRFWAPGADRRIVFSNVDDNGSELWTSDGTSLGTLPLTDIAPGALFASPGPGVLVGNRLVFPASDGTTGESELHAIPFVATGGFAATSLGAGCVGSNGTPSISLAGGAVALGAPFTLAVSSAAPTSAALWFFDLGFGALPPLGACVPQLAAPAFLTATATDASGSSAFASTLTGGPALAGVVLDVQALSFEPGGPFVGIGALSDVLELVVGP